MHAAGPPFVLSRRAVGNDRKRGNREQYAVQFASGFPQFGANVLCLVPCIKMAISIKDSAAGEKKSNPACAFVCFSPKLPIQILDFFYAHKSEIFLTIVPATMS